MLSILMQRYNFVKTLSNNTHPNNTGIELQNYKYALNTNLPVYDFSTTYLRVSLLQTIAFEHTYTYRFTNSFSVES